MTNTIARLTTALIAGLAASTTAATAADVTFAGKTITVIVAGGVGGGIDAYARTFLPFMTKHLPGNPNTIVQNMPGGGGVQGVQALYNLSPKDGTAIGTTPAGPIKEPVMGASQVNYDLRRFNWFGSLTVEDTVCLVWHASSIKTIDDARAREVPISATGAASNSTLGPMLLNTLIGTRFKPISGYDGGTSMLAVERQEVDGRCTTMNTVRSTYPQWLANKLVRPILRVSSVEVPEFPGLVKAADLLKTDADRQAFELFQAPDEIQNPFMLPPDVSAEIVAVYRKAFDETVKDPAYLEAAASRRQMVVPKSGDAVQKTIASMYATPPEVVALVKRATAISGEAPGKEKK